MKKIIALVLSLCLLCGAAALADGDTYTSTTTGASSTVTYTVPEPKPEDNFIVTIPSAITIDPTTKKGSATVTLASGAVISGNNFGVYLYKTENDFCLKNVADTADTNTVAYSVATTGFSYVATNEYAMAQNGTKGVHIIQISNFTTNTEDVTGTIDFTVKSSATPEAGVTYSDKLTFTIHVW